MLRLLCALVLTTAAAVDSSATRWEAARLVSGFLGLDKQREAPSKPRGLQVIGGGFARTGTKSTEAALLRLGHKIYDTRSILECQHADRWVKAAWHSLRAFSVASEFVKCVKVPLSVSISRSRAATSCLRFSTVSSSDTRSTRSS